MNKALIALFLWPFFGLAQEQDTITPPKGVNYVAYKYLNVTPANMKEAIASLTLLSDQKLDEFAALEIESAMQKGVYSKYDRLGKDWGFETGSQLTTYFWSLKVYAPSTMKTAILMGLHKILNGEKTINVKRIIRKSKKMHRKEEKTFKKKYKDGTLYYNYPKEKEPTSKPQKKISIDWEKEDPEQYPPEMFFTR